jgi:UDP-GlcNAc:undecaprenyl-phosphate/decaprenyl-phosphate GlcNAc-1-phosphate transferase
MKSLLLVHVLAVLTAALSCKIVRFIAMRHQIVSSPSGRDVHDTATPRIGGVSIFLGIVCPLLVLFQIDSSLGRALRGDARLVDDLVGLRALHKLAAQIVVAALAYGLGFRVGVLDVPLFGPVSLGILGAPATIVWIVSVMNAINLIDGLDGLAGGIVFLASLTNIVVALVVHSYFTAIVLTAVVGALVGFLYHNFNPARIFMGDGGSYLLGYVLGVTVLAGNPQKASAAVSILVPFIALGVPIFDMVFSIFRRALERRPIFSPDRGHIHHRLLDVGLTHRRAVLVLYGVSVLFCASAIATSLGRGWHTGLALALSTLGGGALLRATGLFTRSRLSQAPGAPAGQPEAAAAEPVLTERRPADSRPAGQTS